jgi:hypothetical protein
MMVASVHAVIALKKDATASIFCGQSKMTGTATILQWLDLGGR